MALPLSFRFITLSKSHFHKQDNNSFSVHRPQIPHSEPEAYSQTQKLSIQSTDFSQKVAQESLYLSKRQLKLSILALILNGSLAKPSFSMGNEELELEPYTDSKEGFTLLRPLSWVKVDKAGATALFEEENKGGNNIGVVVSPVKIGSLEEFGSPQFVADKLIQAEKRKESTKDAEVIGVTRRSGKGDLQVYEFEYKVDSTRGGMKRIFSAAFVASKKLYLLNITHADKPDNPLDVHTRSMLEKVLHSFDAAPLA